MAQRTILSHGDVLLVGPVVALLARPDGRQVHERPPGDDADGELGLARRTDAHPGENREQNHPTACLRVEESYLFVIFR